MTRSVLLKAQGLRSPDMSNDKMLHKMSKEYKMIVGGRGGDKLNEI